MKDIIGTIKDKVSLSKLALLTKPNTLSLHVAVLRTTSHAPSTPPNPHHLATLLTLGNSSRATASILIHSLMNRLHRTTDSHVALKCLFTVHHIIKRGPFILKDQLSVFTATGGRNNFKLSNFRDGASAATWVLSAWVRWYACYVETTLYTSKNIVGSVGGEKQKDLISSFMNFDLIQDFASLVCVIEEICKVPDNLFVENNVLLHCLMELLAHDYLSTVNEIFLRVIEFKERVELLSFNDSVELASALDRLTSCKEKLSHLFSTTKPSVDTLWEMVEELNNKIGMVNLKKLGRRDSVSESARFGDRVIRTSDSLKFMSGRLRLNMTGV
ncbi:putative ANTH domain, ENTH domain-containing protein [Helianthus debilis subsp. tardiflorus]